MSRDRTVKSASLPTSIEPLSFFFERGVGRPDRKHFQRVFARDGLLGMPPFALRWNIGILPVRPADILPAAARWRAEFNSTRRTDWKSMFRQRSACDGGVELDHRFAMFDWRVGITCNDAAALEEALPRIRADETIHSKPSRSKKQITDRMRWLH